jgi:hypothetical protein
MQGSRNPDTRAEGICGKANEVMEHFNIFGVDIADFLRAFIVFIGAYLGTKHGNGSNGK